MPKKSYPRGFRLTLATARRLAVQEFGTAKGLEPDRRTELEGYFTMTMGNLRVSIRPDMGMSGCQRQLENVGFRRKGMSFFAGQYTSVYSLNHHITCRKDNPGICVGHGGQTEGVEMNAAGKLHRKTALCLFSQNRRRAESAGHTLLMSVVKV